MRPWVCTSILLLLSACTRGSGVPATEDRPVAAFERLEVKGALSVTVQVGAEPRVQVQGDDNVVPKVRTEVEDQTLHVDLSGSITTDLPLELEVSTGSLQALGVAGASTVQVRGLTGERLKVRVNGASTVTLEGQVTELEARVTGASTLKAPALTTATAEVEVGGASRAEIHATDVLDARAQGASSLRYHGQPGTLHRDASGASTIEPAG